LSLSEKISSSEKKEGQDQEIVQDQKIKRKVQGNKKNDKRF
jgi:hypothetical protein